MFVYTFKFSRRLAVAIILVVAVAAAAVVILASADKGDTVSPGGHGNDARVAYLRELGWEVEPEPVEERGVILPREFDSVYEKYNALQLEQGFDLLAYAGLEVRFFSYRVLNYPGTSDEVLANLIVRAGEVIGGDIHSTALDGFIHGIK